MKKIFDENGREVTPDEAMAWNVQHGSITLSQYMQWLMTERTWDDVKDSIIGSIDEVVKDETKA